jgi:Mor family transcriptional regulator
MVLKRNEEIYQKILSGNTFRETAREFDIDRDELRKIFSEQNKINERKNSLKSIKLKQEQQNKEIYNKILSGKIIKELSQEYDMTPAHVIAIFYKMGGERVQITKNNKTFLYKEIYQRMESGKTLRAVALEYGLSHERIRQIYNEEKRLIKL